VIFKETALKRDFVRKVVAAYGCRLDSYSLLEMFGKINS